MDFEKLLSAYQSKTCIVSVEAFPESSTEKVKI